MWNPFKRPEPAPEPKREPEPVAPMKDPRSVDSGFLSISGHPVSLYELGLRSKVIIKANANLGRKTEQWRYDAAKITDDWDEYQRTLRNNRLPDVIERYRNGQL